MIKVNRNTDKDKYVYCFAFGGLNDCINQLLKNYNYCKQHGRKLFMNSLHSEVSADVRDFFDVTKDKIVFQGNQSDFNPHREGATIFPSWASDIENLSFMWNDDHWNMVDKTLQKPIFYNHGLAYDEKILVEANCRNTGDQANVFFKRFPPKANIIKPLKERFEKLPRDYISVHIRNTDYKSNVTEFLDKHKDVFRGKNVFLASDNTETIAEFKNKIDATIYQFSNIPKFDPTFAHGIQRYKVPNKEELNIDSIVDLILLSFGKEYYFSCGVSGFSKSAKKMHADQEFKTAILDQMKEV